MTQEGRCASSAVLHIGINNATYGRSLAAAEGNAETGGLISGATNTEEAFVSSGDFSQSEKQKCGHYCHVCPGLTA